MFEPNHKTFKIFSKLFGSENGTTFEFQSGISFLNNSISQTNATEMIYLINQNNNSLFDSNLGNYYLDLNTNEIKIDDKDWVDVTSFIKKFSLKIKVQITKEQLNNLITYIKHRIKKKHIITWIAIGDFYHAYTSIQLSEILKIFSQTKKSDFYDVGFLVNSNNKLFPFIISENLNDFHNQSFALIVQRTDYTHVSESIFIRHCGTVIDLSNESIIKNTKKDLLF